jgi:rod shape-determining protein MreD
MSTLLITLLLLAGALLQTMLPVWGLFGALEIPLLTGLLLCIALRADRTRLLYAAVLAGLLHDVFCPAPLGLSIPFFVFLALGVYLIRKEIFGDEPVTYAVLGALAALLQTLYFALVFALSGLRPVPAGLLALRLTGGLVAGACTALLAFSAVSRIRHGLYMNRRYRS